MIAIIDYGVGNLRALLNAFHRLRVEARVVSNPQELQSADKIILPGVGSFETAITNLTSSGLSLALNTKVLDERTPVLGICLGMQLMATNSEEGDGAGLNWIPSEVIRFSQQRERPLTRIPHMGWNEVRVKKQSPLFDGISSELFYFLHSYYMHSSDKSHELATTDYASEFTSAVFRDGYIFGVQFHPEKSHSAGERLLKNFCELS